MAEKNKVDIYIAGKQYTLVGVESDEYMQKVALYIDKKMNEITKFNNRLSTNMVAILTAINVADDYLKAHEREENLKIELKKCTEELQINKNELNALKEENNHLAKNNTALQLELAKREAELSEVRHSIDRAIR